MFISVNNIRLYYEKKGEGNPLILLHGNEENHFIFDEAVEKLKKYYKEIIKIKTEDLNTTSFVTKDWFKYKYFNYERYGYV